MVVANERILNRQPGGPAPRRRRSLCRSVADRPVDCVTSLCHDDRQSRFPLRSPPLPRGSKNIVSSWLCGENQWPFVARRSLFVDCSGNGPISAPTSGAGTPSPPPAKPAWGMSSSALRNAMSNPVLPIGAGGNSGTIPTVTMGYSAPTPDQLEQAFGDSLWQSGAVPNPSVWVPQAQQMFGPVVTVTSNAWNYTRSGTDALVHNPSALGPGTVQGGANLGNSVENFGIGLSNSVISASNLLDRGINGIAGLVDNGAKPFQMATPIPYANWSSGLLFSDPAHNVEMGLNSVGITALSIGVGVPGEVPAPPVPSVWSLGNFVRGNAIEDALGANLPRNFPIVDRLSNGIVTSIKSIDLNAATYQDSAALGNKLNNYVDAVAGFNGDTWGDVVIEPGDIAGRQLQVAVPTGAMSPAQQAAFEAATARAQNLGVNLVVTPVR